MPFLANRRFLLTLIARTDSRFSDFAPYVASINDDGLTAFQAALREGGSGVYTGDGAAVTTVMDPGNGPVGEVCSHPDLDRSGTCCFYGKLASGERGVFLVRGNNVSRLADSFGPLGPTINDAGSVAFRADTESGASAIFAAHPRRTTMIAETGEAYAAFQGLPVINRGGSVAFRADLQSGRHGIYVGDATRITRIAETGAGFASLGAFPILNDTGAVGFAATLPDGGSGIFIASDAGIEMLVDSTRGFESFRGVLINTSGPVAFFATPTGGSLGIYTGPHPLRDCLLAIGSPIYGSTIAEFALNPVSVNNAGQLAIRVRLSDQRQFILRADPGA